MCSTLGSPSQYNEVRSVLLLLRGPTSTGAYASIRNGVSRTISTVSYEYLMLSIGQRSYRCKKGQVHSLTSLTLTRRTYTSKSLGRTFVGLTYMTPTTTK